MAQLLLFYKLYDGGEGRMEEREEERRWIYRQLLRALYYPLIIMLFIQGHITTAHTLQAVWFLKGTLNIESNQVKQSQNTRKGNVAPPNRQRDAVIFFNRSRPVVKNQCGQMLQLMGEWNLTAVITEWRVTGMYDRSRYVGLDVAVWRQPSTVS